MADEDEPRCRYCFEGKEEGELIAPCACRGHQKWAHHSCLIKWQRRQGRGTASCEVCKAPWTVLLHALDRELFVRAVRTNPRYPAVDEDALDEAAQAAITALMRPGFLILQTPARAEQAKSLPNVLPVSSSQTSLSLFAYMLSMQRTRHWLHGTYLILSRGASDASDQSDSIVAINLSRLASAEERDAEPQAELRPLFELLAPVVPPLLIGGPCHQTQPLCLVEVPRGHDLPSRGDALRLHVPTAADALQDENLPHAASPPNAGMDTAAEGVAEGGAGGAGETAADTAGGTAGGAESSAAAEFEVIVAEPVVAAAIVRSHGTATRVVVVQGCAIWSTAQLLSEMSRHKWGLAPAALPDLPFGAEPPIARATAQPASHEQSSAESASAQQASAELTSSVDSVPAASAELTSSVDSVTPASSGAEGASSATVVGSSAAEGRSSPRAPHGSLTLPFGSSEPPPVVWEACWRERNPACTAGMPET